uniref:Uncharacterized protein n=1 Tax=Parascaris univalens TaxID=6257 RepID=A0A915CF78_PARUN
MRSIVVWLVLLDVATSLHADGNEQPSAEKYRSIDDHKYRAKAPTNADEINEAKSDRWSMLASPFISSGHNDKKIRGYGNDMMHKVRDVRRTHQKRSAEDIDTEHKGTDTENEEDYGRIALFPGPVYERVGEGGKKGRQKSPPSRVDDKNARSDNKEPIVDNRKKSGEKTNSNSASGIGQPTNVSRADTKTVPSSKAATNESTLPVAQPASKPNRSQHETKSGILPVDGIKHQPIDSVVPVERINETSDITSSFPNSSPSLPGRVETVVTITYSLTTGQLITPKIEENEVENGPGESEIVREKRQSESDDTMFWAVIVAVVAMLMFIYLACGFCIMCKTIKEISKAEALAIKEGAIA